MKKRPPRKVDPKDHPLSFVLDVLPNHKDLDQAIEANGRCNPSECWHKIAIEKLMERKAPHERHMVYVDAGHILCNYHGWRYKADTPKHVKRSLMLFDAGQYDELSIRKYRLKLFRYRKVQKQTTEQKARINANRAKRIAAGSDERTRRYPNLRARVAGFSAVV